MSGCLFCNIVAGKTPADLVFENEHVVAFRDIRPAAPSHALVIPRVHITGMAETLPEHAMALGQVILGARATAEKLGLLSTGYRLAINQGPDAGQTVLHLHAHVLGGRPMAWPPG